MSLRHRLVSCRPDELTPGSVCVVDVEDRRIAVFNVDGELVAIDDRCAHKGGSLAEGMVRNGIVTCPQHWWRYDLRTGRRVASDEVAQQTYAVAVVDGVVEVEVPALAPAGSMRDFLLRHAAEWNAAHRPAEAP